MISVTRRFEFCAGHRLLGHEGKCRFMHGHNYTAEVTVARKGNDLDDLGRVIDFKAMKEKVGGWIDFNWDHAFIFDEADVEVARAIGCVGGQKFYKMEGNPTAENMAVELRVALAGALGPDYSVTKIVLWETPNCAAEYDDAP